MVRIGFFLLLILSAPFAGAEQPLPATTREAVQQRIADAALAAMLRSDEAEAVAIAAKSVRKTDLKEGEKRSEEDETARHAAALSRALELAPNGDELVEYQVVAFCLGNAKQKLCAGEDRAQNYANRYLDNVLGWLTMAGREYSTGFNDIAQVFLESAAKATRSEWHFAKTVAIARRYVNQVVDKDARPGDRDVAALTVAGEMTLPPFGRFAQMCNPGPMKKLPEGRFPLCRKVANIIMEQGQTNVERDLALRTIQRLNEGEDKVVEGVKPGDMFTARQAAFKHLWSVVAKYPPQTDADAAVLTTFIDDLLSVGEIKASERALQKAGKRVEDFLPKT